MNLVVWKFPIDIQNTQVVLMPAGAEILCSQTQGGVATLWAKVTPSGQPTRRLIEIFGTGHPMDDADREYIDTIQVGPLVWHIFERLS